jgi:hypothetical protein
MHKSEKATASRFSTIVADLSSLREIERTPPQFLRLGICSEMRDLGLAN